MHSKQEIQHFLREFPQLVSVKAHHAILTRAEQVATGGGMIFEHQLTDVLASELLAEIFRYEFNLRKFPRSCARGSRYTYYGNVTLILPQGRCPCQSQTELLKVAEESLNKIGHTLGADPHVHELGVGHFHVHGNQGSFCCTLDSYSDAHPSKRVFTFNLHSVVAATSHRTLEACPSSC